MPSRLAPKAPKRRSHITTGNSVEMRYWAKHFKIDDQRLTDTIVKVGNSVAAVRKELTLCITQPVKVQPPSEEDFGGGDFASLEIQPSTDDDQPLE